MASRQAPRAEPMRAARRASTRPCRRTGFVERSLVELAGVLAAMEHVLHERSDAGRVGTAGPLELPGTGSRRLWAHRCCGRCLDLVGHGDFVMHDARAP